MKNLIFKLVLMIGLFQLSGRVDAQVQLDETPVAYTFFVNSVPDGFCYPMLGFINLAHGDFYSAQVGFVNSIFGYANGMQMGFVNSTLGDINGLSLGYVNVARKNVFGAQVGFVNTSKGDVQGGQVGFVNNAGMGLHGLQVGFVNRSGYTVDGGQLGYVNVAEEDVDGAQIGFVNRAKKLNGFQLGFVNVADTVESGFPFGFISVVKRGGYKALGFYWDEIHPYNLSFRIGLRSIYSTIVASYNPDMVDRITFGGGFGSILPLSKQVFFNPEITTSNIYTESSDTYQQITALVPNIGFNVSDNLHITAGPTFAWHFTVGVNQMITPNFWVYNHMFDANHTMHVGARVGIHYVFQN